MKRIEKPNQTSPMTSSPTSLPNVASRPKNETAQIGMLVRQSFDLFNTFGKDPKSLASILPAFEQVLAPYPINGINDAFAKWLRTKTTMPTPADILAIVTGDDLPLRYVYPVFRDTESPNDWGKMNAEERAEFEAFMVKIKKPLEPIKTTQGPGKLDYSHWERLPDEARETVRQNWIASWRKLREGLKM